MLGRLLREERASHAAVAFDMPGPTFRHRIYADYKANRPETPDDLKTQFPSIKEMVEAHGIRIVEKAGYEGEDILGTLARKLGEEAGEVVIASDDKDCLQLVGEHVQLLRRAGRERIGLRGMQEKYGILPSQWADFQSLVGDSTDNIKGVPGIGPKRAAALLRQFGNLEELLGSLEEVGNEQQRMRLAESRDLARLSRRLTGIECEVPLKISLEDCRIRPLQEEKLKSLYRRFEFKRRNVPSQGG